MRKYDLPLIIVFVVFAVFGVISFINNIVSASHLGEDIAAIRASYYSYSEEAINIAKTGIAMCIITIIVLFINDIICTVGIYGTHTYGYEDSGNKLFYAVAVYFGLVIVQLIFSFVILGKAASAAGVKFSLDGSAVANLIFLIVGFVSSLVAVYFKRNDTSIDAKRAYYAMLVTCLFWLVCLIISSASTSEVKKEGIAVAQSIFEYLTVVAVALFSIYFVATYSYVPKKKYAPKVNTTANYQSSTQSQSTQSPQPQPQPQQNQSNKDIVAQLEALKSLRDKDILTEEEYQEKRKKLVDKL